jgi:hypothetical protein
LRLSDRLSFPPDNLSDLPTIDISISGGKFGTAA